MVVFFFFNVHMQKPSIKTSIPLNITMHKVMEPMKWRIDSLILHCLSLVHTPLVIFRIGLFLKSFHREQALEFYLDCWLG